MDPNKPAPTPLPFTATAATLDNLISGKNSELIAAVRKLATGQSNVSSIYLWGESGCGKSTLLRAACLHARGQQLATYFVAAGDNGDILPPLGDGLLAVDDVHALPTSGQITLFDWHNRSTLPGQRQFLLASGTCAPTHLPLREELTTRLSAGLVFRLQTLSDDEKNKALSAWAERHGFTLQAEIADFLLTHLPRNMHTLTAYLTELDAFFLAEKKPLTLRRVSAWLKNRPPHNTPPTPSTK
ncbi:MAG: DnaA regulatory inactivator Hda [Proteobacteria bacterium]|nr:DnaA regulatory inactivator Hda [Pseudomonadota bacterium]